MTGEDDEPSFRVQAKSDEIWIQLRPRVGPLGDLPDPQSTGVFWHRLTRAEAETLRDAITLELG